MTELADMRQLTLASASFDKHSKQTRCCYPRPHARCPALRGWFRSPFFACGADSVSPYRPDLGAGGNFVWREFQCSGSAA